MEIPISAKIFCSDGLAGHSTMVIIDPRTERITHVVIQENHNSRREYLVPVELILQSNHKEIHLNCTRSELENMDPFKTEEVIKFYKPVYDYTPEAYAVWPAEHLEDEFITKDHENIPFGELVIRRRAPIYATNGRAGKVDEFIVNPDNDHITHIVMQEGHLWGQKEITIPISYIDHVEDDSIYLNLDKSSIEKLPAL